MVLVFAGAVPTMESYAAAGDLYAINPTYFPSSKFREYVSTEFDKDQNGILSAEEISNAKVIGFSYQYAGDLKGVEIFYNLEWLICDGNNLTSLDVSQNTKLEYLTCGDNKLTELDLSHNPNLDTLHCSDNQFTELDVTHNPALRELNCMINKLTALDVTHNTQLQRLECQINDLSKLDLSNNPKLSYLDCQDTELAELDVSHNPELEYLHSGGDYLTSIDVSKNPKLLSLILNEMNISELDVSHNPRLRTLWCFGNNITFLNISENPELIKRYRNGVSGTDAVGDPENPKPTVWYDLNKDAGTRLWVDAATEIHIHSWGAGTVTTEATEEHDGVRTYTCSCGAVRTEVIPMIVPDSGSGSSGSGAGAGSSGSGAVPAVGAAVADGSGNKYTVTSNAADTVAFTGAVNKKSATVPDTVTAG